MTNKMQKKMERFIYDLIEDTNRSNIVINGNTYNKIEISNACEELLTKSYKLIDKGAIIDYCHQCADTHSDMLKKALSTESLNDMQFSAIAYFMQKEELYRYTIPNIINNLLDDKI